MLLIGLVVDRQCSSLVIAVALPGSCFNASACLPACLGFLSSARQVILDVVFNHTAEGNEMGPTISFRGIDNRVFYMTAPLVREGGREEGQAHGLPDRGRYGGGGMEGGMVGGRDGGMSGLPGISVTITSHHICGRAL